jgi:hypothetical protein
MSFFTPEERARIYLEEKARLDCRKEFQQESSTRKPSLFGKFVGLIVTICVVVTMMGALLHGSASNEEKVRYDSFTPNQKRAEHATLCGQLEKDLCTRRTASYPTTSGALKADGETR